MSPWVTAKDGGKDAYSSRMRAKLGPRCHIWVGTTVLKVRAKSRLPLEPRWEPVVRPMPWMAGPGTRQESL